MIKTLAYFPSQCALNSQAVMTAMLNTLTSAGIQTQENSFDCDAAIIWSMLWYGRMQPNHKVYEHYRRQGRPVIVVDVGALNRGETWKIAVNHINALGYFGHTENLDFDRPKKLGIGLAVNTSTNPAILIAAQHQHSHQLIDVPEQEFWINQMHQKLISVTDRPIHVRPHPRSRLDKQKLDSKLIFIQPEKLNNTYDSYNLCFDYHAVVNYNSGPGTQAALLGSRPIVDRTSLASPVGVDICNIEKPYITDREQWLIEICHTEYTLDEIKKGLWLKRITPALTV